VKSSPIFGVPLARQAALQPIYDAAPIGLAVLTRWVGSIGLAVAVGIAYFVAARIRENTPGGFLLPRHHQPSIVPNT